MGRKNNEGFSLIEVLVAIVLLGALVVPTCSGLVMSLRMNRRTEEMMHEKLAVSSAVEILMAEGITGPSDTYDVVDGVDPYGEETKIDRFPEVTVVTEEVKPDPEGEAEPYYQVTVATNDGRLSVTTYIRKAGGGGA